MNWSKYLVWTPEHKEQLLKFSRENILVRDEKFIVVGAPIPLSDNDRPLPVFKKNTISIFDVTPTRLSFYVELCLHVDYFTPRNSKKFLRDIESLRQQLGFNVVLKSKRENKSIHDPSYIRLLASLKESGWLILDPTTSPNRIINGSEASIHFPFTSTGVIASELKKKSIYYDPSGNIASDDEAGLGPILVNSKESLRAFIVSVLSENQPN
jgi:polysaccharide biosynthesis PFTS motif protein